MSEDLLGNESQSRSTTSQQALVLFDWVKRFNERESEQFEDQARERVLKGLGGVVEKALEPFQATTSTGGRGP